MLRSTAIAHNVGGMKSKRNANDKLSQPTIFKRETKPQIALKPLCFIPCVMVS